jgi:hypothetical protein
MQRLFLAAVFALLVAPVVRAEDPKPGPTADERKQIADLKAALVQQIADLEAALTKNEVELAKAQAAAKVVGGAHQAVKAAGAAQLKELKIATDKALVAPRAKAAEAKTTAVKAARAEADTAGALDAARAKLKSATDPKEAEELKKTIANLEVALKEKVVGAKKAQTVAQGAEDAYKQAETDASAKLREAANIADTAAQTVAIEAAKANKVVAQITDERDVTEAKIRKLKQRLAQLDR